MQREIVDTLLILFNERIALVRLGENSRQLRNLERRLQAELKPTGAVGEIWFDRFWSSYLRCLLAARAEAMAFTPESRSADPIPVLKEDTLPTIVYEDPSSSDEFLSSDLFRQLALIGKYDRHFSREMYRALAMLMISNNGNEGLERCLVKTLNINKESYNE